MARRAQEDERPKPVDLGPLKCRVVRGPRDDGRWYWRIDPRGRGARALERGWHTSDEVTKRAAQLIADGTPDVPDGDIPQTVGQMLVLYADDYRKRQSVAQSTKDNVRRSINHIRDHLSHVVLSEVTKQTIKKLCRAREREGAAAGTLVKEWVVFASIWNEARESGWVTGSLPSHDIEHVTPAYCHATPTEEEVDGVLHYLRHVYGFRQDGQPRKGRAQWPWVAMLVAKHTGARIGTIEKMQWQHVDLSDDARTLILFGKTTKKNPTGRRSIRMTAVLRNELRYWWLLQGQPGDRDYVLGASPGLARSKGTEIVGSACEATKVERFTWHGVRRLVVRRLRRAGVPVTEAAAFMGHSKIVMLRLYDEATVEDTANASARMEAFMLS